MFRNRSYDQIKPLLPDSLRLALRRRIAMRQLRRNGATWPIDERAGHKPTTWPGWPQGKRFAFVLTHDVERAAGLARSRQLMELEMQAGFRSLFNFLSEGPYEVPTKLRAELDKNQFEVGLHDPNLYRCHDKFLVQAPKLRSCLREWEAVGFRCRSGHDQGWLHNLNLQYDSSTCDTNLFDPQAENVHTIFPFWVTDPESSSEGGYVELPTTLPTARTLFVLLREQTIDTWKRKLEWIAENGGMALLVVQPDDLNFGSARNGDLSVTYGVSLYQEFLEHVKTKYRNQYWHALPREIANFLKTSYDHGLRPGRRKRVCMVTYSHYESDNRVMRYAGALAERGDLVDVIALEREGSSSDEKTPRGIQVRRIQKRKRNEKGKFSYFWRIGRFLVKASAHLAGTHLKQRYDLVHIHNVPDLLVFTAWLPKLAGTRLILDIHDILPEFYASKFKVSEDGWMVRGLRVVERLCASFADHVIVSNHLWAEKLLARSVSDSKCSVFLNYVDLEVFRPIPRTRRDDKPIVIYPGGLQVHQGLDIAIRAFAVVQRTLPAAEFHIYGEGPAKADLVRLAGELGLDKKVLFFESRPIWEIPSLMANADVGVVAKRADSFGNEAYSTKIMELMSQGVPVVATRTKIDAYYFNDSLVRFFESGNVDALAAALLDVLTNAKLRTQLIENTRQYVRESNWDNRKGDYLALVDSLSSGASGLNGHTPLKRIHSAVASGPAAKI